MVVRAAAPSQPLRVLAAALAQMHPKAVVVCDEDATLELRVKTVKYFEGLAKTTTFAAAEDTEPTSKRQKK